MTAEARAVESMRARSGECDRRDAREVTCRDRHRGRRLAFVPRWTFARAVAASAAAFALAGCAPSLSTMQPAHVAKAKHVQAEAGYDVSIPTGTIGAVVDAAKPVADAAQSRALTADEEGKILDAGVALAANPPSFTQHAGIAVGLGEGFEAGLRYAAGGFRLGGRYQLLDRESGPFDLSVGLGISRYAYAFPIGDVIGILKLDDFSRWQFDVPILLGVSRNWYRVWGGARLAYTRFDTALRLALPFQNRTDYASFRGSGTYVGLQGGVALGYKYLFVAFELTTTGLSGHADAMLQGATHTTKLDGFVVQPALALIGEL
jgi:hypothetical protein